MPASPPTATEAFEFYLGLSEAVPGWTRGAEARELMRLSHALPDGAQIVEIGSFLGSGAILLAGSRRLRGSGIVHCVDPFDASGDAYSVPYYGAILAQYGGGTLRDHFARNIANAGLSDWVQVHQARGEELAARWARPVDLLFLDGDQSRAAAREVYCAWLTHVKRGGIIALHNSHPDNHRPDHDGNRCLAEEELRAPAFADVRRVDSTTFAVKLAA